MALQVYHGFKKINTHGMLFTRIHQHAEKIDPIPYTSRNVAQWQVGRLCQVLELAVEESWSG